jgi:hypothetical protein
VYYEKPLPFYMTYPYADMYSQEWILEQEMEKMKSYYPKNAAMVQRCVEDACDRIEYEGSMMYDEYPDRLMMSQMCDHIYNRVKEESARLEMTELEKMVPIELPERVRREMEKNLPMEENREREDREWEDGEWEDGERRDREWEDRARGDREWEDRAREDGERRDREWEDRARGDREWEDRAREDGERRDREWEDRARGDRERQDREWEDREREGRVREDREQREWVPGKMPEPREDGADTRRRELEKEVMEKLQTQEISDRALRELVQVLFFNEVYRRRCRKHRCRRYF